MDSKTLLTNNVFNINVQDFCGSMTVCFVFFCTANVDKKGGWKLKGRQMLLYCCRHAIVILYHPPSGQCSGNEVQRVSQVILHSGGVYVCVYMCIYPYASPLDYAIPFSLTKISLSCLSSPSFSFLLWILILSIMCSTLRQDVSKRTYQIKIDISNV